MSVSRQQRPLTDREIEAWLAAGAVDRGMGEGLTFVASAIAAQAGKASWILRYRLNGRSEEKVLGRYPELLLKDAREQVRQDRAQIERGIDRVLARILEGGAPTVANDALRYMSRMFRLAVRNAIAPARRAGLMES